MRGEYQRCLRLLQKEVWITPTCVGNTTLLVMGFTGKKDHPHLRGEYFQQTLNKSLRMGSPPLAWGIRYGEPPDFYNCRITPTCVGNTFSINDNANAQLGSPPLAWGIQLLASAINTSSRITPTCVGNTDLSVYHKAGARDHPHLRGEY